MRKASRTRAVAAAQYAEARRAARSVMLQAQRAAYDELHRQTRAAVGALLGDPAYLRLLVRLEEMAGRAGPSATVTR